jgi:hypothetical protein
MVDARFALRDHRRERPTAVTVSGSVVTVSAVPGRPVARERVLAETDRALARARSKGPNRVEATAIAAVPAKRKPKRKRKP